MEKSTAKYICKCGIQLSALEVFLKRYALYKFMFYLLTYLLTYSAKITVIK